MTSTSARQSDEPSVEAVTFYSDGVRLAADLYTPASPRPARGYPAVIVCHGWGGLKEFYLGDIARTFASHGFASIAFDYRGFGESEGRPNRIFPLEQAADVRAAVAWVAAHPDVDASRIAAYGTSFGGGIAIEAAAQDNRLKAVTAAVGVGDCERWLRGLRPYWQWRMFVDRLAQDEVGRVMTGESEIVVPEEIMVRDPESVEHEKMLQERYPKRKFQLTLESAAAVREFKPVERVHLIAPRGVLLIGVEDDTLCPFDETLDLYARAGQPKRILALEGLAHHQVYQPQNITRVLAEVAGFYRECMPERTDA